MCRLSYARFTAMAGSDDPVERAIAGLASLLAAHREQIEPEVAVQVLHQPCESHVRTLRVRVVWSGFEANRFTGVLGEWDGSVTPSRTIAADTISTVASPHDHELVVETLIPFVLLDPNARIALWTRFELGGRVVDARVSATYIPRPS